MRSRPAFSVLQVFDPPSSPISAAECYINVFISVVLDNILYITGGSEVTTFPITLSQWTLGFSFGYLPVHIGFWCGVEDDFPSILDVGMVYC